MLDLAASISYIDYMVSIQGDHDMSITTENVTRLLATINFLRESNKDLSQEQVNEYMASRVAICDFEALYDALGPYMSLNETNSCDMAMTWLEQNCGVIAERLDAATGD